MTFSFTIHATTIALVFLSLLALANGIREMYRARQNSEDPSFFWWMINFCPAVAGLLFGLLG